ncbi:MAG: hypothetical protein EXS14_10700 [Planctomycetes bacterium]|nr:hypothetical protein [Planctomycetota bacterium]
MFVMRTTFLAFFLCFSACGDSSSPQAEAVVRASAWLRSQAAPDVGSLHAVREAALLIQDDPLLEWVRTQQQRFAQDGWLALLDPHLYVPRNAPTERGHTQLHWYLLQSLAPSGDESATRAMVAFLEMELHGYMLTHQLYALRWARERTALGAVSPDRVQALVRRMYDEAAAVPVFSDLFAEQVNLLLAFEVFVPKSWTGVILSAQRPDGSFVDATRWSLEFDGERIESVSHSVHTTAQAILVLARLQRSSLK